MVRDYSVTESCLTTKKNWHNHACTDVSLSGDSESGVREAPAEGGTGDFSA